MEIQYGKEGRDFWESGKRLTQKHGSDNARKIQKRIKELQASPTLADMPPAARPHQLHDADGCIALDIKQPFRLIVKPCGDFDPQHHSTVKSIEIITVIDYH